MSSSDTFQLISSYLPSSPTMKKSVCRCLFGRPDRNAHDEVQDELRRQLDDDLDTAKLKWGYDFKADKPVETGSYEWSAISKDYVPSFYTEDKHAERRNLKVARNPKLARGKARRSLFNTSASDNEAEPELSFSAARLRGESKQATESPRIESNLTDDFDINLPPIQKDISTPCMKKLNLNEPKDTLPTAASNSLTCTTIGKRIEDNLVSAEKSTNSSPTSSQSQSAGDRKLTKQSHLDDYFRSRKRKATYSLTGNSSKSAKK